MSDTLTVFGKTWNDVTGFKAKSGDILLPFIRPQGSVSITENGTIDVTDKASAVVNIQPYLQSKIVTPTKSQQTIVPDGTEIEIAHVAGNGQSRTSTITISADLTALVSGDTYHVTGSGAGGNYYNSYTHFTVDTDIVFSDGVALQYTVTQSGSLVRIVLHPNSIVFTTSTSGDESAEIDLTFSKNTGLPPYDGLSSVVVNAIPSQYVDTSDATAAASEILRGKTAYVNGLKLIGTLAPPSPSGDTFKYEIGTFTLDSNWTAATSSVKSIPHTLGAVPDIIIITPDSPAASGDPDKGYIWFNKALGESSQYLTSSVTSSYPSFVVYSVYDFGPPLKSRIYVPTSSSYTMNSSRMPTSSDFKLFRVISSTIWYAGTYNYFIAEKWW